jgi:hypothetical protein
MNRRSSTLLNTRSQLNHGSHKLEYLHSCALRGGLSSYSNGVDVSMDCRWDIPLDDSPPSYNRTVIELKINPV